MSLCLDALRFGAAPSLRRLAAPGSILIQFRGSPDLCGSVDGVQTRHSEIRCLVSRLPLGFWLKRMPGAVLSVHSQDSLIKEMPTETFSGLLAPVCDEVKSIRRDQLL